MIGLVEVKLNEIKELTELASKIWHEYWKGVISDEQIDYMVNTIKDCVSKMRQSSPLWKEICNENN